MTEKEIIEYLELRMNKLKNNKLTEGVFSITALERNFRFIL